MAEQSKNTAFVKVGGDAGPAVGAFAKVQQGLQKTAQVSAKTGDSIASSMNKASKATAASTAAFDAQFKAGIKAGKPLLTVLKEIETAQNKASTSAMKGSAISVSAIASQTKAVRSYAAAVAYADAQMAKSRAAELAAARARSMQTTLGWRIGRAGGAFASMAGNGLAAAGSSLAGGARAFPGAFAGGLGAADQRMGALASRVGDVFRSGNSFGGLVGLATGVFTQIASVGTRILGGMFNLVTSGVGMAYRGIRNGIIATIAAVGTSIHFWHKEIEAQTRLDYVLKANVKNYRAARAEIDKTIYSTQRKTNFSDDDVRNIYRNFVVAQGESGVKNARRLTGSILDFSAAQDRDPGELALGIARAIATGNGRMLAMQGLVVDKNQFARDRMGAIESAIETRAGGAAEALRRVSPFRSLMNNAGDVVENIGSSFAKVVDPYVERASRKAQDLAQLTPEELMNTLKTKGIEFWEYMKVYGKTTWEYLGAILPIVLAKAVPVIKEALGRVGAAAASNPYVKAAGVLGAAYVGSKVVGAAGRAIGGAGKVAGALGGGAALDAAGLSLGQAGILGVAAAGGAYLGYKGTEWAYNAYQKFAHPKKIKAATVPKRGDSMPMPGLTADGIPLGATEMDAGGSAAFAQSERARMGAAIIDSGGAMPSFNAMLGKNLDKAGLKPIDWSVPKPQKKYGRDEINNMQGVLFEMQRYGTSSMAAQMGVSEEYALAEGERMGITSPAYTARANEKLMMARDREAATLADIHRRQQKSHRAAEVARRESVQRMMERDAAETRRMNDASATYRRQGALAI